MSSAPDADPPAAPALEDRARSAGEALRAVVRQAGALLPADLDDDIARLVQRAFGQAAPAPPNASDAADQAGQAGAEGAEGAGAVGAGDEGADLMPDGGDDDGDLPARFPLPPLPLRIVRRLQTLRLADLAHLLHRRLRLRGPLLQPDGSPPKRVDLRPLLPPVYQQGLIGSCTAQTLCALVAYDLPALDPSRLFLYFCEREREGTLGQDGGAFLETGVQCLEELGVCAEASWPYREHEVQTRPPPACFQEARQTLSAQCLQLPPDALSLKRALAQGFPCALGILLFPGIYTRRVERTGRVPLPRPGEAPLGGHAVCCCGYDDDEGHWIFRNSWGSDWGDRGYFYLPYAYLDSPDWSTERWILRMQRAQPRGALASGPAPAPAPAQGPAPAPAPAQGPPTSTGSAWRPAAHPAWRGAAQRHPLARLHAWL